MNVKIVVIGGGLAGIVSAIRLKQLGYSPILIDSSLPDANRDIGGFAKFSGAKFSLPPAGMGLLNITKCEKRLWQTIDEVANLLELDFSEYTRQTNTLTDIKSLREYTSILLTPERIDEMVTNLTSLIIKLDIPLINGVCKVISPQGNTNLVTIKQDHKDIDITCNIVFYAGGRMGDKALTNAGITPKAHKGIDVGFRVEFLNKLGLSKLRELGPDAKILKGTCRTFCLNYPGHIYHYPFESIDIPGGVVASKEVESSNVGILCRCKNKYNLLSKVLCESQTINKLSLKNGITVSGSALGESEATVRKLYGDDIAKELLDFCNYLSSEGLVDWNLEHKVHLPLIDWHWKTFAKDGSFKTDNESIYCVGDSSGHARGLLQAAVSGWLAAEEYCNES